ncbi:MAG TPA: S8 family serine peptidase [Acidimicrobiales bacterium]|nr:S8 family serine peptidase [Acidimicrobiales bacterium]
MSVPFVRAAATATVGAVLGLTAGVAPAAAEAAPVTPVLAPVLAPVVAPAAAAGEVLVAVRPGTDAAAVASRLGVERVRSVPGRSDVLVVEAPVGDEADVAARLDADPAVTWASPNAVAHVAAVPNDPLYRYQWHLGNRATAAGSANLVAAAGNRTGLGVKVAVIDTGVTAHADLDGVLPGFDYVDNDSDPSDLHGHGTHVAGTVAESTDNGIGAAGVAPGASILPVRVLDAKGDGTYDKIIAGINYAVSNGAKILNLSFAGSVDGGLCDAVARATAAGTLVVAAAGNDAGAVAYPAACAQAVSVSAVTMDGRLASYSNRGSQVTIAAPGGDGVNDTNGDGYPDGVLQYSTLGGAPGYYFSSGTSMASPHVAGAAALALEVTPSLTPAQLRSVLTTSATEAGATGVDSLYGAGLLDIAKVVTAAASPPQATPAQPTPAPAPQPAPSEPAPSQPAPSQPPPSQPAPSQPAPSEPAPSQPAPAPAPTPAPATATARRVSGESRFATASAVSAAAWPEGAEHAYLASGRTFADALASGGLAGHHVGPVLLTDPCNLPATTLEELRRLRVARVTIVGGGVAVCDAVASQMRASLGVVVDRIAGADRYDTAAALSRIGWEPATAPTVYLASGEGFADGLSGGALAAHGGGPLLLTSRCTLPEPTRAELVRLAPGRILVLGGAGAICDGVLDQIRQSTPGTVLRVAGEDRYATATAGAADGWQATTAAVFIVSGSGFADGLAAAPAAARVNAPLLLVPACDLPVTVAATLRRLQPSTITVVGGPAAVCDGLLPQLEAAVRG